MSLMYLNGQQIEEELQEVCDCTECEVSIEVEQVKEVSKGFFVGGELIDWFAIGEYL